MKPGEEMKIHVLASGSKGNMVLISSDSGWVAIDCGISKRKIINKLAEIQLKIEDIKHLIITHEHSDHTAGLKALIQTGNIETIYLTQGTFDMIRESSQLNESIVQIIHPKKAFAIDGFTI